MQERVVMFNDYFDGTLAANVTRYLEFREPVVFKYGKATASNDSSATLALSGANTLSIAAQTIGDSNNPSTLTPASTDVVTEAANGLITITLDYDGTSGTAAEDVHVLLFFATGEPSLA